MKRTDWRFGLLAAAVSVFCVSCCFAEKIRPVPVRLMSYNVRHCCGADQKVDIDRTVAAILREKPDLAGIQELDCRSPNRSGGVDQPAELGRRTGMHATFAAGIKYPNNGGYGVAVLSKEKPQDIRLSKSLEVIVASIAALAPVPIPSLRIIISFPFSSAVWLTLSPQILFSERGICE
jgi:hypothetical protein